MMGLSCRLVAVFFPPHSDSSTALVSGLELSILAVRKEIHIVYSINTSIEVSVVYRVIAMLKGYTCACTGKPLIRVWLSVVLPEELYSLVKLQS